MPSSESPNQQGPENKTSCGWLILIVGLSVVGFVAFVLLPLWERLRDANKFPVTPHNMKQFGLAFKIYANESEGEYWPTLAPNDAVWVPDIFALHPEYMSDPGIMVSAKHPNSDALRQTIYDVLQEPKRDHETAAGLMGLSFAYLGYAVKDEAGFAALVEARNRGLLDGNRENIPVPGHDPMVFPLREGIERFFITDINGPAATASMQSTIPVMIEIADWKHKNPKDSFPGAYVLYMDGHVKMVRLGNFPVMPEVMDVLSGLAEGLPATSSPTESNAATTPHP